MQSVLAQLHPETDPFFLGLTSFPSATGSSCSAPTASNFPADDATITLSEINAWYAQIVGQESGGTPTAAALNGPVANDPQMQSTAAKARKFIILITDGLPNCNDNHPCVTNPNQHLWSDGEAHGCESQSWLAYSPPHIDAGPPASCSCSLGSCPNPGGP